jgi:hypothetical protein
MKPRLLVDVDNHYRQVMTANKSIIRITVVITIIVIYSTHPQPPIESVGPRLGSLGTVILLYSAPMIL